MTSPVASAPDGQAMAGLVSGIAADARAAPIRASAPEPLPGCRNLAAPASPSTTASVVTTLAPNALLILYLNPDVTTIQL